MLQEEELIEFFKNNGITAFRAKYNVDEDMDVLLHSKELNVFLEVCNILQQKVVFYNYHIFGGNEDDTNKKSIVFHIKNYIKEYSQNKGWLYEEPISEQDRVELEEKYCSIALDHINLRKKKGMDKEIPFKCEIYVPYNGCMIGLICEEQEGMDEEVLQADLDLMLMNLERDMKKDIDSLLENKRNERAEKWERERAAEKIKYQNAIEEIKKELAQNDELMTYTNGKMRQSFSRDLTQIYKEKYNVHINIGTVNMLVEQEYKRRKHERI